MKEEYASYVYVYCSYTEPLKSREPRADWDSRQQFRSDFLHRTETLHSALPKQPSRERSPSLVFLRHPPLSLFLRETPPASAHFL